MRQGAKHLIQCHCILPQYRDHPRPIFHKFPVFSILEDDKVIEKLSQCPNCGVIHKVTDLCKSEIASGKDESKGVLEIKDIKISLSERLIELLESYSCDLSTWEHAQFIVEEKRWGEKVRVTYEESEDDILAKFLVFIDEDKYRISTEMGQSFLGNEND